MAREFFPGVGQAVAARTILRDNETWADVAHRVAEGNASLHPTGAKDREALEAAIASGGLLMSGRHLQHGDADQPKRNLEIVTNCATASQRSLLLYLLLNGSGVGTCYDDDMMIVDWARMPTTLVVLDKNHPDNKGRFYSLDEALEEVRVFKRNHRVFRVPDSREGWAEAIQEIETAAWEFERIDEYLILDFSDVRPEGSPIGGMQGRPSSGPVPLMEAIQKIDALRDQRLPLWLQAMTIDHLLAEIVLVGGARRAARIAVKWWEDTDILDFINVKEKAGLWTANNSIGVDHRFWSLVDFVRRQGYCLTGAHKRAWDVFQAATHAQYNHGTGEPGFLNLDLISDGETNEVGETLSGPFNITSASLVMRHALTEIVRKKPYPVIVNPCGEIRLSINGGYCVIADIVPSFCENFVETCRLTTRALMRTNLMDCLYEGEVRRTNRIGVGLTGVHEYAAAHFGLSFKDLIAEGENYITDANGRRLKEPLHRHFWETLLAGALAVEAECHSYAVELGVSVPLTRRTFKPAGTTSKLFGLTEGAHLPSMREYLRWVQFRENSPLVAEYEAKGYPVRRNLKNYKNVVIVGFPTRLLINELLGDDVVTASEATPEEQFRWLRLLETYWLLPMGGNQISYTLKYDPQVVDEAHYRDMILDHVPTVRAVSIMAQTDATAYEYQPEEPISRAKFDELVARIQQAEQEDIGLEHVGCASGACPVSFDTQAA